MSCKRWRLVAMGISVAGVALFLAGYAFYQSWNAVNIGGIAVILIGMIVNAVKFRCPACRRHISDRVPFDITRCPFCGALLEEGRQNRDIF